MIPSPHGSHSAEHMQVCQGDEESREDSDDGEGDDYNEDAEPLEQQSAGSETDSLDELLKEDLGLDASDTDEEAAASGASAESDFCPWLGDAPAGLL